MGSSMLTGWMKYLCISGCLLNFSGKWKHRVSKHGACDLGPGARPTVKRPPINRPPARQPGSRTPANPPVTTRLLVNRPPVNRTPGAR